MIDGNSSSWRMSHPGCGSAHDGGGGDWARGAGKAVPVLGIAQANHSTLAGYDVVPGRGMEKGGHHCR
jgi:hypothetical protein